jgi:hypothetical protein
VVDLNLEVDVNLDFAKSKSNFMILLDHVIYFCISLIVLLLYYNTQGKLWIDVGYTPMVESITYGEEMEAIVNSPMGFQRQFKSFLKIKENDSHLKIARMGTIS